MKRIFTVVCAAMMAAMVMAQLPYGTEMTKDLYNDPTVVLTSEGTIDWSSIKIGSIDYSGLYLGKTVVIGDAQTHSIQIALPSVGLPDKLYFSYASLTANGGALAVYESTDHINWSAVWSGTASKGLTKEDVTASLKSSTRYIKFEYIGKAHELYNAIRVTEKKALSVSTDEYQFATAKVDDAVAMKEVTINWTNIVGTITSSNPAFTVSRASFGEKNKENETTKVVISYNHDVYGTQTGEIVIEGEGLKSTIQVSGTTERYVQTLTWNQDLGQYSTIGSLHLNAYTDYLLPVSYVSSDSSVAWVDSLGNVQVVCAGAVTFTAQQAGNYKYAPTTTIAKSATFVKAEPTVAVSAAPITYGQRVNEVVLSKYAGNVTGKFEIVNIGLDSVLDAGIYDLTVRFTPDEECIYNTVYRQVSLTVNKAAQTITWEQEITSLAVDETIDLTASATSQLPLTYAFTNCNIVINGNRMTGSEAGKVLVIAFQEGNKNYLPTTVAMQPFVVLPAVPTGVSPMITESSIQELQEQGQKYYHNGQVWIYYRGQIYNAEGKLVINQK